MIFLGDIAHPFPEPPGWAKASHPWEDQSVIVNLEGPLNDDLAVLNTRRLFNHSSILSALEQYGVKVACLANNHIMDLPEQLSATIADLKSHGMDSVGAGANLEQAGQPALLEDAGKRVVILAFGWKTIQCQAAKHNRAGVNPLDPAHVLASIKKWRQREPQAAIVALMHWNYEMELYPHPAHRQLAFAVIDAGGDAVIGHHPHRVGGVEFYKDKVIAYSVGNWWLPQGRFFGGALRFADDACLQLALEWHPCTPAKAHWFHYSREDHSLSHVASEFLADSAELNNRGKYVGLGHDVYRRWFRTNRVKRKLLPIYSNYRSILGNHMRDEYVLLRHKGLVMLERSGLRKLLKGL